MKFVNNTETDNRDWKVLSDTYSDNNATLVSVTFRSVKSRDVDHTTHLISFRNNEYGYRVVAGTMKDKDPGNTEPSEALVRALGAAMIELAMRDGDQRLQRIATDKVEEAVMYTIKALYNRWS